MNSYRDFRFLNKLICSAVLILFAVLGFSGCATPMALDVNKGSLANLSKPIGIFTLRT